jgi:AraC family transcriptional regulator, ethanolamine operon transcriptional activator
LFARIMLRRQNGSAFFRRRLNAERPYYSRYNFPGRRPKIPGAGPLLRRNVAGQVIAQIAWPNAPDWTTSMTDNFGGYADKIQAATVSFLKSESSVWPWDVKQIPLDRTVLQFGMDGGAGLVHGVTDPNLFSLIMQITEFDDQVWLDGVPCPSRTLITLPPETHFTFVRTGPDKWLSWSIPTDDALAQRLQPPARSPHAFKTEKHMMMLSMRAASAFRAIADDVFGKGIEYSPDAGLEEAMYHHVAQAWERNDGIVALPSETTRSSEQIVFRALRYVQSRGDENVEIGDLARVTRVNYRTLLRAFERYLKISPKRYLKLRQINAVYHAIRRSGRGLSLADILATNGVSEFGRFAGEYRAVFNEVPSATHQRQMSTITTGAANASHRRAGAISA